MKANKLGILSALTASVCCVGPLVLLFLGLGTLGFGAVIGRYHWWFILGAMGLLAFAWRSYLREARQCRTSHCEMAQGKTTRFVLILASLIVALFMGLNLYTYSSQHLTTEPGGGSVSAGMVSAVIPVEGMTCFTCELGVESASKRLPGVRSVDAKVNDKAAYVQYDPAKVSLDDIIASINKTGYRATRPLGAGAEK